MLELSIYKLDFMLLNLMCIWGMFVLSIIYKVE
jgi:hypothetical protein